MYRQGDVGIIPVEDVPKSAKKQERNGRIILAEGEATGHAHAVLDEDVSSFVDQDGVLFLDVKSGASVVHEEHDTIKLPRGKYKIIQQREYTPEGIRNVLD